MYYIICNSLEDRTGLIDYLRANDILSVFHYLSLHKSPYYKDKHDGRPLKNTDHYSDCLLRLPMYFELTEENLNKIIGCIYDFYSKK